MARVWFVRRRGGEWVAPGGVPACEVPLADIVFPLDVGTHRRVSDERPVPAPEEAAVEPAQLQRVFVEVGAEDLEGQRFTGYRPGVYDSPYSPAEASRRLAAGRRRAARAAA